MVTSGKCQAPTAWGWKWDGNQIAPLLHASFTRHMSPCHHHSLMTLIHLCLAIWRAVSSPFPNIAKHVCVCFALHLCVIFFLNHKNWLAQIPVTTHNINHDWKFASPAANIWCMKDGHYFWRAMVGDEGMIRMSGDQLTISLEPGVLLIEIRSLKNYFHSLNMEFLTSFIVSSSLWHNNDADLDKS